MLNLKKLLTKILSQLLTYRFKRIVKSYNATIPSSSTGINYVKIDDYHGLGVDTSNYLVSMSIRGWSGKNPLALVKGQDGTAIYLVGESGSISLYVEYYFANPSFITSA